ncbi:MAG: hypothetical protein KBA26_03530 [Candidatus Delongbacteria bacterium]|nr:hypothetical protein [Candidatus Delongbacteria bacterium]
MKKNDRLEFFEQKTNHLLKEKQDFLSVLELAANLSSFESSLNKVDHPDIILREIEKRILSLIHFQAVAFFLVREEDSNFVLSYANPVEYQSFFIREHEILIEDDTFAWCIKRNRPILVTGSNHSDKLLLHALDTPSRARGVFIGLLSGSWDQIPDTTLMIFSIIMHSGANMLESFELYRRNKQINQALENSIMKLKLSEAELTKHRSELQTMVDEQTKELRLSNEQLKNEISQRIRTEHDLITAKQTAEKANKIKSQFLANMSHELRTPLNAIVGMIHLMSHTALDSTQVEYLEYLKSSSEHLLTLINGLLDLTAIESHSMKLQEQTLNLQELIDQIHSMFMPELHKKQLEFQLSYQIDPEWIFVSDRKKIKQILFNLIDNAVKFTHQGKIRVEVIPLNHSNQTTTLKISVSDTGIGIPEDRIPDLFQVLTQLDDSYSKKYGGIGIGLILTKNLVELMGGSLYLESRLDQGTWIEITLPLKLKK